MYNRNNPLEDSPRQIGKTRFALQRVGNPSAFRICEIVTPRGYWITWPGLYVSPVSAIREIVKETRR